MGMDGPCPFCPIPKLQYNGCAITGNWYWVKDSVIRWVDGTLAHFKLFCLDGCVDRRT